MGRGHGGGGAAAALQTVCCWGEGGGVDCEIKMWHGGSPKKKCPAPPPQLINNDRPLKNNRVSPQHFSFHNTMLCLGR